MSLVSHFNSRVQDTSRALLCVPELLPGRQETAFQIQRRDALIDAFPRTSSNATLSTMPPVRAGSGTVISSATPSAATFWWRSAYASRFGRLLAPASQRVDLLSENLPLPLPSFAGDDSTMHAAGECTSSIARGWLSRAMAPASAHAHNTSSHIHIFASSSLLTECVCLDSLSRASRRQS